MPSGNSKPPEKWPGNEVARRSPNAHDQEPSPTCESRTIKNRPRREPPGGSARQTVALVEKMWTLAPIGVFLKIQIASLRLRMFTQPWLDCE